MGATRWVGGMIELFCPHCFANLLKRLSSGIEQ